MIILIMLVGQVRPDCWKSWGFCGGMWRVPPLLQVDHDHHDHGDGDHGDHGLDDDRDEDDDNGWLHYSRVYQV